MNIKVLGSGCSRCKQAFQVVEKVVRENPIDAQVEYITDIMQIMQYDVLSTPAIVVDGKVRFAGGVPSEQQVKELLGL